MTSTIRERLGWTFTPELYDTVRRLWIEHSLAEDRRDLPGLIATLTPDCVYEVVPTGERWEGHAGGLDELRQFTETVMEAIALLSGQERVDQYASRDKGRLSAPGSEADPSPDRDGGARRPGRAPLSPRT